MGCEFPKYVRRSLAAFRLAAFRLNEQPQQTCKAKESRSKSGKIMKTFMLERDDSVNFENYHLPPERSSPIFALSPPRSEDSKNASFLVLTWLVCRSAEAETTQLSTVHSRAINRIRLMKSTRSLRTSRPSRVEGSFDCGVCVLPAFVCCKPTRR